MMSKMSLFPENAPMKQKTMTTGSRIAFGIERSLTNRFSPANSQTSIMTLARMKAANRA